MFIRNCTQNHTITQYTSLTFIFVDVAVLHVKLHAVSTYEWLNNFSLTEQQSLYSYGSYEKNGVCIILKNGNRLAVNV